MLRNLLIVGACAIALTACVQRTRPPGDVGVCYQVQPQKDGSLKYNKLASAQPDLEHCAGALEAMRIKFINLGGNQLEIMGAYQGNFIFLRREGIFTASSLEGNQYLALVRTGDGRLAIPGAMPQQ